MLNTYINDLEQVPASDQIFSKAYHSCQLFINILYYISIVNIAITSLLLFPLIMDRL